MAFATQMTLTTEHQVLLRVGDDPQKDEARKDDVETGANEMQNVSLSVTYALERSDRDVAFVATRLAAEVAQAHRAAVQVLRACAFAPPPRSAAAYKNHSASSKASDEALDDDSGDDELELDDPLRPEDQDEEDPSERNASEGDVSENDASDEICDADGEDSHGEEACEGCPAIEYPGKRSDRTFADRQAASPEPLSSRPSLGQAIGDVISVGIASSRSSLSSANTDRGMSKDPGTSTYPHGSEGGASGPSITHPQKIAIRSLAGQIGIAHYELTSVLYQQFGTWSLERLSKEQAHDLHVALQRSLKDKKEQFKEEKVKAEGLRSPKGSPSSEIALSRSGRTATPPS